jgi:recombination protein RecA
MTFGRDTVLAKKVTQGTSSRTGIPSLDIMLGRLPWGFVELAGEPSTGKTGMVYQLLAQAQTDMCPVALLASEILDVPYMTRAGLNPESLPVFLGANAIGDFAQFIYDHPRCVVGIDSLTALRPEIEDASMWNEMIWAFLKMLTEALRPESCVIAVSQMRKGPYSSKPLSATKRFLDFFQTRLELSRKNVSDKRYDVIVNIAAHQLSLPARFVELPAIKGIGVDVPRDILRAAVSLQVLEKNGHWYSFGGNWKLGPGEDSARAWLLSNPEALHMLKSTIYDLIDRQG